MLYPQNIEEKIGFLRIRELVSDKCLCTLGRQRVQEMQFSVEPADIARCLSETDELMRILEVGDFPDCDFHDLRLPLKRIRMQNTFLEVEELLQLCRSLSTISEVVSYLKKMDNDVYVYPRLAKKSEHVMVFPQVVVRIRGIIDDYGNVLDGASPDLVRIRREKSLCANRISGLLNHILRQAQTDGLVEKNVTPTLRDGRLVIPVAPALKRKIGGIVHDESDSGRTVYIEPTEVVEANNEIRKLENEERKEIIRILRELTSEIRPYADEMLLSYEYLADIDFIRAKALFSCSIGGVKPQQVQRPAIDWSQAVHPLLKLSFDKKNQRVVPLDIELKHPKRRILLISGPNAGGKSVCLKTVGLLQYMFQCGMPVPVSESSVFGIFKSIFIDIGDEQSIDDDLSTYSSHLLNMKQMLRHCDATSLLLIDEFGGGTEPQIGGAIAEALLKRFNVKHAFGVITTHYQNLKHFAQETMGVVNGAMLYDRQLMQPLFQLHIGNPGSSFAVEIARKIGIPEEVIKDASDIVGSDYMNSDKYVQDIVRDKRYWENKRQAIHQHEKHIEQAIARYEADIERLRAEKREIIAKAKEEALQLLQQSNARIEQTIKEIKEAQAERERTKDIRQEFAEFKQEVSRLDEERMEEHIALQAERIRARQQRRAEKKARQASDQASVDTPIGTEQNSAVTRHPHDFAVGDYVRLQGQNTVGRILRINGTEALVAFGSIQTNVSQKRLEHTDAPQQEKRAYTFVGRDTQEAIRETALHFQSEIDVRGMRTDEAIQAVTYFLDDAVVASAHRLRILHGTGNGILRTMIRQYLNTVPAVATFHDEDIRLGGAGITIVELI